MILVFQAIAEHHNEQTGRCDPSSSRLAAMSGCNQSTVSRSMKALREAGLLRPSRGDRQKRINLGLVDELAASFFDMVNEQQAILKADDNRRKLSASGSRSSAIPPIVPSTKGDVSMRQCMETSSDSMHQRMESMQERMESSAQPAAGSMHHRTDSMQERTVSMHQRQTNPLRTPYEPVTPVCSNSKSAEADDLEIEEIDRRPMRVAANLLSSIGYSNPAPTSAEIKAVGRALNRGWSEADLVVLASTVPHDAGNPRSYLRKCVEARAARAAVPAEPSVHPPEFRGHDLPTTPAPPPANIRDQLRGSKAS